MRLRFRALLARGALLAAAGGCAEPIDPAPPPAEVSPPVEVTPPPAPPPSTSAQRHVYLSSSSGGEPQRVAPGFSPAWSPDGSKVAFVGYREPGLPYPIYVMNADGTGQRQLTSGSGTDPVWSPDGSKLAFVSGREYGSIYQLAVSVIDADGTDETHVWLEPGGWCAIAGWSPDGARIAFVSAPEGSGALRIINSDGTNLTTLTDTWVNGANWSRDGRRFALHGQGAVFTMNADGSGLSQLTDDSDSLYVRSVKWSPRGDAILFDLVYNQAYSNRFPQRSRPYRIHIVSSDGTRRIGLTAEGETVYGSPRWLPGGRTVGWFTEAGIWVVPAEGGQPSQLLPDGHDPAWSPTGARIAYVRRQ